MADAAPNGMENRKFTYADYKAWELDKGERFELLYGEACAMAAPGVTHQRVATQLIGEFYAFLKGRPCEVFAAPFDVRLFCQEDESDDTVVQPDLVVVCDPEKLGAEGCRGAPDMGVEVLLPSNMAVEMNLKLKLYLESAAKEYWVVDPANRQIDAYRLDGGRYVVRIYRKDDAAESVALAGLTMALPALFGA